MKNLSVEFHDSTIESITSTAADALQIRLEPAMVYEWTDEARKTASVWLYSATLELRGVASAIGARTRDSLKGIRLSDAIVRTKDGAELSDLDVDEVAAAREVELIGDNGVRCVVECDSATVSLGRRIRFLDTFTT